MHSVSLDLTLFFLSHLLCLIYFIRLRNTRQLREGLPRGYGGIEREETDPTAQTIGSRRAISTNPKFLAGVIILRSVVFVCAKLQLACVDQA